MLDPVQVTPLRGAKIGAAALAIPSVVNGDFSSASNAFRAGHAILEAQFRTMVIGTESGSNSMVESQPSKLLVAGSIPVSRSKASAGAPRTR